jgi:hypothetical protein
LNGNGVIDKGAELMGVDTVKRDNTKAKDGFDALADLDSNQDGVMNAQDTAFASLRIWRDLNQDGISQPGELQTLAQAGIVSINVSGKAAQVDLLNLVVLGKGNVQTVKGSFTRSDSSTGGAGETSSAAANLDLLVNTFYRTFTTTVPLTEAAKTLPDFLPPPLGEGRGGGTARHRRHLTHVLLKECRNQNPHRARADGPARRLGAALGRLINDEVAQSAGRRHARQRPQAELQPGTADSGHARL